MRRSSLWLIPVLAIGTLAAGRAEAGVQSSRC